ncbi:hypothetical protein DERP_011363 [Dermatophagoides pteronyssinus]|uniref:Uncharacterized protein n=1 Tax=Dermatophagoides pteronyssinus TaxID=6956 RepID=A0ABQ8J7G6_DERPT|nr:hypothetical protein DERP_011363 [Dermatophagoides pteronyssinus]
MDRSSHIYDENQTKAKTEAKKNYERKNNTKKITVIKWKNNNDDDLFSFWIENFIHINRNNTVQLDRHMFHMEQDNNGYLLVG